MPALRTYLSSDPEAETKRDPAGHTSPTTKPISAYYALYNKGEITCQEQQINERRVLGGFY